MENTEISFSSAPLQLACFQEPPANSVPPLDRSMKIGGPRSGVMEESASGGRKGRGDRHAGSGAAGQD
jgi:hypothetical protein